MPCTCAGTAQQQPLAAQQAEQVAQAAPGLLQEEGLAEGVLWHTQAAAAKAPPPPTFTLVLASNDQTRSFVALPTFTLTRSVAGFNDAFTDVRYIPSPTPHLPSTLLAAATNSEQLRLIDSAMADKVEVEPRPPRRCRSRGGSVMPHDHKC